MNREVWAIVGVVALCCGAMFWWVLGTAPDAFESPELTADSPPPPPQRRAVSQFVQHPANTPLSPRLNRPTPQAESFENGDTPGSSTTQAVSPEDSVRTLEQIADEVTVWPTTRDGIDGAVGEVLKDIHFCYQRALNEGLDMEGRLDLEFVIAEANGLGTVQELAIVSGSFDDGPTEDCLMDVMSVLQFQPPEGEAQTVHYPFDFSTG